MCTVAAAFAGKYLAAIGQQLLQRIDILVIDIGSLFTAEPALRLLTNDGVAGFLFFLKSRFWFHSHSHCFITFSIININILNSYF